MQLWGIKQIAMNNTIEKEINALLKGGQRRAQSARTMFLLEYSPEQARALLDQLHAAWYNGSPTLATAEEVYTVFRFYKSLSLMLTATYMLEEEGRYWEKAGTATKRKKKAAKGA